MEVIGADGMVYDVEDDVDGDVMGDVLGYDPDADFEGGAEALVGYDDDGSPIVIGARRKRRRVRRAKARSLVSVSKPKWRRSQLAPGVIAPDQGLLPLPMAGVPSNVFDAATNTITFQGQIQKPFRGERLLVSTVRTGTSAVGLLQGQLFVGTDLNQLDVPPFDVEQVGAPNAFGVRLAMKPAQPGVFIRLVVTLSNALTTTDTILASVTILGRNLH